MNTLAQRSMKGWRSRQRLSNRIGEPQRGSPRIAGRFNPRDVAKTKFFPGGEAQCWLNVPCAMGYRAAVEDSLRYYPGFPAVTRGYSWENRSAVPHQARRSRIATSSALRTL